MMNGKLTFLSLATVNAETVLPENDVGRWINSE